MTSLPSLVKFVESQAGETLRAVAHYDPEDHHIEYLRDDIDKEGAQHRLELIVEDLIRGNNGSEGMVEESLGEAYASVLLREQAVIIRLATADAGGVIISLDPEAGRNLTSFIATCFERLHGQKPPT